MVPAIAALSAIAVVTTTSKATNSQMHSIHSRSVDSLSVMAATAICCQEADVDSSPDAQEAADDMLLMSDEEEHPGLPWKLLDLGYAHVKGKGFMKTYLLQVCGCFYIPTATGGCGVGGKTSKVLTKSA